MSGEDHERRNKMVDCRYRLTDAEYNQILSVKRDLHMHPELSGQEVRTTGKIREFLQKLTEVIILDLPVQTGLLARIPGEACGAEVALRADIDALPQTEIYESEWRSVSDGVMHACGHDFHTASLLGAALILDRAKKDGVLKNTVDFLFQPAEEGTTGARMMIDSGLFELIHPDYCFGLHNWPSVEGGKIVCRRGALMAGKRNMTIVIKGAGGHGSMPHLNRDPIVCAAAVVQSLQTIVSRNTDPLNSVVLSISRISGGSHANVVADRVEMNGTIRSLSEDALDRAIERTESIVRNTAAAYECGAEVVWKERIPPVFNSDKMQEIGRYAAVEAAGEDALTDAPPSLASEDFASYGKFVPSCFFWVGSRTPGEPAEDLHRPGFHTFDEAMKTASNLLASCAFAGQ